MRLVLGKKRKLVMAFALVAMLAACKSELYTGLSEREANEMVAALLTAGIPASKSGAAESLTVFVDDARFSEAMALLDEKGLPAQTYANMGEIFKKEGLVSSPTEERARMIYALSEELSRTIAMIDGVLSARIHVVLPEADMLGRDVKPSSASVFVRYAANTNVQDYAAQIKLLVANSIEGLLYDNITVVMVPVAAVQGQPAQAKYAEALGVSMHPSSIRRFWAIIGALGGLLVIAVGVAGYAFARGARHSDGPRAVAFDPAADKRS